MSQFLWCLVKESSLEFGSTGEIIRLWIYDAQFGEFEHLIEKSIWEPSFHLTFFIFSCFAL